MGRLASYLEILSTNVMGIVLPAVQHFFEDEQRMQRVYLPGMPRSILELTLVQ